MDAAFSASLDTESANEIKSNNLPKLLTFNVGGQVFTFSSRCLLKEGNNFLLKLYQDKDFNLEERMYDEQGNLFLDHDSMMFNHIARYLRGNAFFLDTISNSELYLLLKEAEFFGLENLVDLINPLLYPVASEEKQQEVITYVDMVLILASQLGILHKYFRNPENITAKVKEWTKMFVTSHIYGKQFVNIKSVLCTAKDKNWQNNSHFMNKTLDFIKTILDEFLPLSANPTMTNTSTPVNVANGTNPVDFLSSLQNSFREQGTNPVRILSRLQNSSISDEITSTVTSFRSIIDNNQNEIANNTIPSNNFNLLTEQTPKSRSSSSTSSLSSSGRSRSRSRKSCKRGKIRESFESESDSD